MRQPPRLGDLAHPVGLTEKRPNTGFRLMFGATVFEALRNERLDHARQALEEGTASLIAGVRAIPVGATGDAIRRIHAATRPSSG
jgi:transcriptional regulator GlxA family with amidase domain